MGVLPCGPRRGGAPGRRARPGCPARRDRERHRHRRRHAPRRLHRRRLAGLADAMADGVDVRGYFHWTALDNYEWGSYRPTFGLIQLVITSRWGGRPSGGWWLGSAGR
ncbi:family 1 glycosylhydrolase [Nonomuraea sp. WAC 01424]|uniref:family 1 glycosylhydrolase n=1 Tax=Nonomuraea sp. WAC 01424 TaxID=2203200 RepID=UPI00289DD25A|nr:family 1 glycosylhydrolase [Nonomuraea sp. WAC 01424]